MTDRRRTLLTTVALVLVALLSAIISTGAGQFRPEAAARAVVGGVQRAMAGVGRGIGNTVRSVGELRRLREDYESLLSELEQYQRLEGTVEALERENARLREQLGFVARSERPVIAARVIAREQATGLFNSFTINRGSRHGVMPDQAVVGFSGDREGLIGRVTEVSGGTALVVPVFAPGSYVAARLERSRHGGLLEGTGESDGGLILRYLPRSARTDIRYGDLVITSGLNSIFPEELPVGQVERVAAPSWETSLIVEVEPLIDYARLEYVFVLQAGAP